MCTGGLRNSGAMSASHAEGNSSNWSFIELINKKDGKEITAHHTVAVTCGDTSAAVQQNFKLPEQDKT